MALGNLSKRILSSIILAPIILTIIIWGGLPYTLMIVVIAIIASWEWFQITANASNPIRWKLIGLAYIGIPCLSFLYLEQQIIFLLLLVWSVDIGAYVFGKAIGGPKLAPKISPNKTWAGLLGGIVFTYTTFYFIYYTESGVSVVLLPLCIAIIVTVIAQAGDLFESWVKRHFGVKDSGNLIPGHGGLLDRIDGLMFIAPPMAIIVQTKWAY